MTAQPTDQRAAGLLWWLCTVPLALTSMSVNIPLAATVSGVPLLIAFAAGVAQGVALVLIALRPTAATLLQFLAVAVFAVSVPVDAGAPWPLTVPGMLTLIIHIALLALRVPWRSAVTTWAFSLALVVAAALLDPHGRAITDAVPILVLYPSNSALALGGALAVKHWAAIRRQLAEARRDVVIEQSQRAVAEERTRIARELHDVVAHSMSVIHMQATSASYRIKDLDPEVKEEFTRIAAGARATMGEMRRLLAVLRDETVEAERSPVPDLSRLDELVDSARQAGLTVSLTMDTPVTVTDGVGLAAYRIVQESLSNVIRHAPGARTEICLSVDGLDLVVMVTNDPATASPTEPMETPGGPGHGLAGMRERARLAGGKLADGPRPDGGYRVEARLPIGGDP